MIDDVITNLVSFLVVVSAGGCLISLFDIFKNLKDWYGKDGK